MGVLSNMLRKSSYGFASVAKRAAFYSLALAMVVSSNGFAESGHLKSNALESEMQAAQNAPPQKSLSQVSEGIAGSAQQAAPLTAEPGSAGVYAATLHSDPKSDALNSRSGSSSLALDFESYQKNLDDLFYVTMATSPDNRYGMHAAIIDLARKQKQNPKDPEPLISLGHIYRILGQPAEANRFYKRAIRLKKDNYYLYVFSGMMYYQLKQYDKSLKQIERALKLNSKDIYAWLARGRTARESGAEKKAIESYRKVHELDPENDEAIFMLSAYELKQGHKRSALKLFEELHQKEPQNDYVRYQLGALYMVNNEPAETLNLWEDLFYHGERNPEFLFSLSLAYFQTQKYGPAQEILKRLQFMYPREPSIQFMLGETYRVQNRLDEAARTYRALLAEYPGYMNAYTGLVQTLLQAKDIVGARKVLRQAAERISNPSVLVELEKEINNNPEALLENYGKAAA